MAVLTKAKISQLEKKFAARSHSSTLKSVPKRWEDFVKLCSIRSGGEMKQFIPYEYQKLLVQLMQQYPNVVIVKSRQLGTTQAIVSKFLHDACLNAASSSVCFMRNGDDVGSLSRRIKQMLQGLSNYVEPANDAVGYVKLKSLGDIYIKNSSREGIRSLDSITNQLYDESAFIETIEQIYGASSAASALVGDKVSKLIVSTPSARSGWYWSKLTENNDIDIEETCKRVASGELWRDIPGVFYWVDSAGTLKLVLHWRCHPVYSKIDKEYPGGYLAYRMKQDSVEEEVALREYDLRFIDSAVSVFTSEIVRANATGTHETTKEKGARYYLGIDTSTLGSDYFVAPVLKKVKDKYSLVHLYRRRQQTNEYHLYQVGDIVRKYDVDAIGIEVTGGVGQIYYEQLCKEFPDVEIIPIRTTGDSKPAMISSLLLALERQVLSYPANSPVVDELLNFRRQGAKLEAASGKHDDCVMGLCFALIAAQNFDDTWRL
ncbi:hypothetical protein NIES4106_62510 (plasmid) [Fischerella sp. NIES-4106]|nr:hypothetical protein NIES4106_62510 [Fischerella sp. NIES-4106]